MAKTRILYVEDYPVVQQIFVEVLRQNFDVDVAADGKEALDKIKTKYYDFILLDLLLPQVSGIDFLRQFNLGKHMQDKHTHIIVLTDYDNPDTRKEVKQLGVKDYWIKVENTPHALVDRLKSLLESKSGS